MAELAAKFQAETVFRNGRPDLGKLGLTHLRHLSGPRTAWALLRPLAYLGGFLVCMFLANVSCFAYGLAVVCIAFAWQAAFGNMHDLVHGSFDLPKRFRRTLREILLCLNGVLHLNMPHAFEASHLRHHATRCGKDGDPESLFKLSGFAVVLFGPLWSLRIWFWGIVYPRKPSDRFWSLAEILIFLLATITAGYLILIYCWFGAQLGMLESAFVFYVCTVEAINWIVPFLAAWHPHRHCADTMLGQALNWMGTVCEWLLGGLAFHLLHHMYPGHPTDNLPVLWRKLLENDQVRAWFQSADVDAQHTPSAQ